MSPPPTRWHDQLPELAQVIRFLCSLNFELQTLLAQSMQELITRQGPAENWMAHGYKSIGGDLIQGLHKSKRRLRQYDHNPTLHHAMNSLYLLSTRQQGIVAHQMQALIQVLVQYIEYQTQNGLVVETQIINEIQHIYLTESPAALTRYIQRMQRIHGRERIEDERIQRERPD